ncbi:RTC4-like domain-containing protein [Lipomyces orientalis]|uniref:RTC4-like domain-containing protein n=1 Tax=Lipomyces orientalis TaxID=1233043 RepID=A0ACC3TXT2_9ASCO
MSYTRSRTRQSSINSFSSGSREMKSDGPSQRQRDKGDQYNPPRSPPRIPEDERLSAKYAGNVYRGDRSRESSRPEGSPKRYLGVTNESEEVRDKRQKPVTKTSPTMSVGTFSDFLHSSPLPPSSSQAAPSQQNPYQVSRSSEWQSGGTGPPRTSWSRQSSQGGSQPSQSSQRPSSESDRRRLASMSHVERGSTSQTYRNARKTRRIRDFGASIDMSDNDEDERPTQMRRRPRADSSPDELFTAGVSDMSSQHASPERPGIQLDQFKQLMELSTTVINEANQQVVEITIPDRAIDDNDYLSSSPAPSQLAEIDAIEMKHSTNEHERTLRNFDDKIQLRTCPMCGMEVSDGVRCRFKSVPDSLRRSYAICISHRRESTLEDAKGKNYPTDLDEGKLAERAEKYTAILPDIINEIRPSIFQEKAKAGAVALGGRRMDALGQMEDGLAELLPGYYGLKGNSVLLRVALRSSESAIRRASRRNRWITNVSITGYASAVLVPELAIRLIMEDQNVNEDTAEKIRQESIEYGRVVFGDERDLVDVSDNNHAEDKSKARKAAKKKKSGEKSKDSMNKKKSEHSKNIKDCKKNAAQSSSQSVIGIPSPVSLEEATTSPRDAADDFDDENMENEKSRANGKSVRSIALCDVTPTKSTMLTPATAAYEDDLAKTDDVVAATLDFIKMFEIQR